MCLSIVLMLLYYLVGAVIFMLSTRAGYQPSDIFPLRRQLIQGYASYIKEGPGLLFASLIGIVLSLQGYSWLHDRRAVDFYESQPIKRSAHFAGIFINSLLIYLASAVLAMVTSVLAAFFFGALTPDVLLHAVLYAFLRDLTSWLACFSFGTLAAMLTGNSIVALLAVGVFFCYELLLNYGLRIMMNLSFYTYCGTPGTGFYSLFLNPLSNAMRPDPAQSILRNLILAVPVLALAYFAFVRRKNESAGQAVVFAPVRIAVKVAVAMLFGILAAVLFWEIGLAGSIFCGLLAALLICCVMEIIYHYDFKKLFAHLPGLLTALAGTAAVICIFRFDLCGYDRWIPRASRVESAAVFTDDLGDNSWYEPAGQYMNAKIFATENMHLTDTEAVVNLAKSSLAAAEEKNWDVKSGSWINILYRMKSGRTVCRSYPINRADPDTLNAVTDTDAYRKGSNQIWHDSFMDQRAEGQIIRMVYTPAGIEPQSPQQIDYHAFRDAYRTDLSRLNYRYMLEHRVIGSASIYTYDTTDNHIVSAGFTCKVYDGFDNTLAFLKENHFSTDNKSIHNADDVSSINVSLDVYTLPDEMFTDDNAPASQTAPTGVTLSQDGGSPEKTYTDPEQIRELIDSLFINDTDYCAPLLAHWGDYDYSVYVELKGDPDNSGATWSMSFREGQIPGFVKEDFSSFLP